MEDHNKSNAQRKESADKTILDLTPEMELTGPDDNDIIDLTKALDSSPSQAAVPNVPDIEDGDTIPQPQDLTPASDAGSTEATEEINDDRTPAETTDPHLHENSGKLFDQLSGLTQQVDSAIIENPEGDAAFSAGDAPAAPGAEDGEEILDRDHVIEPGNSGAGPEQFSLDAAGDDDIDLDEVVDPAETDHAPADDDEVMELTDIVERQEILPHAETAAPNGEVADFGGEAGEEDILELTDIVQPEKIQAQVETATTDDEMPDVDGKTGEEDILELTDIVQPEKIQAQVETATTDDEMPDVDGKTDEEDILELTDIVQPEKIQAQVETATTDDEMPDVDGKTDEEDILELTDIVQPEKIQAQAETATTDDEMPDFDGKTDEEDILELTDIVQPEKIQAQAETATTDDEMPDVDGKTDEEDILELTDIVQPEKIQAQVETATTDAETADFDGGAAEEDILEPTDIVVPPEQIEETGDDGVFDTAENVESDDTSWKAAPEAETVEARETASDTAELADLFMDEMTDPDEPLEQAPEPDRDISADVGAPLSDFAAGTDDEDQVIQLADVLNQGARTGFPPMEQVKLGAEEDIDARPISIEQEDTANSLGLDLEDEAALDRKILAIVEQVIQEKYAGTIEALISQAVEKAVTREIEALKRTLSEDDDSIR
jgi:hypothetical protein